MILYRRCTYNDFILMPCKTNKDIIVRGEVWEKELRMGYKGKP